MPWGMQNNMVFPQKPKNIFTTWSSYSISRYMSKRIESNVSKMYLHTHFHSSVIYLFLKLYYLKNVNLVVAHGIFSCSMVNLVPWSGIKPVPPVLQGGVSTTGPLGEVPYSNLIYNRQKVEATRVGWTNERMNKI